MTVTSAPTEPMNIYNEPGALNDRSPPADEMPDSFGRQYIVPVSAGPRSNLTSFQVPSNGHQYHELEPNAEIMETTGHHYHLLDVRKAIILMFTGLM